MWLKASSVQHFRIISRDSSEEGVVFPLSRLSAFGLKLPFTRLLMPRIIPKSTRPLLTLIGMAISSATWTGWRSVMETPALAEAKRGVWRAEVYAGQDGVGRGGGDPTSQKKWCSALQTVVKRPVRRAGLRSATLQSR